jgi:DNA-binding response OmpR family regulator
MVLTDYMLPHLSGGWLLRQASEEGLLDGTAVLVLTAHPNPSDVAGFEIVQKPFDLDDLVTKVRRRLEGGTTRRPRLPLTAPISMSSGSGEGGVKTEPVELILYVSAHSPRTATVIKSITQAVASFAPDRVKLTICDLSKHPAEGAKDGIAFTPTLVKRSPAPRTFILGHITNPSIVTELLESCGEDLL